MASVKNQAMERQDQRRKTVVPRASRFKTSESAEVVLETLDYTPVADIVAVALAEGIVVQFKCTRSMDAICLHVYQDGDTADFYAPNFDELRQKFFAAIEYEI